MFFTIMYSKVLYIFVAVVTLLLTTVKSIPRYYNSRNDDVSERYFEHNKLLCQESNLINETASNVFRSIVTKNDTFLDLSLNASQPLGAENSNHTGIYSWHESDIRPLQPDTNFGFTNPIVENNKSNTSHVEQNNRMTAHEEKDSIRLHENQYFKDSSSDGFTFESDSILNIKEQKNNNGGCINNNDHKIPTRKSRIINTIGLSATENESEDVLTALKNNLMITNNDNDEKIINKRKCDV